MADAVAILGNVRAALKRDIASIGPPPINSPDHRAAVAEAHRRAVAAADADLLARYAALEPKLGAPDIRDAETRLAGAMTAYAEIIAATAALHARNDEASAPVRRLEAARAEAQAALGAALADAAAFDAAEAAALAAWADAGTGSAPAPCTEERRQSDHAAMQARRLVAHVDAALTEKRAALTAVASEGTALGDQRDRAVVAICYETANVIGARYAAALGEAARHVAELEGLNDALGGLRGTDLALADGKRANRPAITDDTGGAVFEQRIIAKAYWLRAHNFGKHGDLCAVATTADITAAAMRWAGHINRLVAMSRDSDPGVLGERARLLAENAALAAQLADAGDPIQEEEINPCS